MKKIIAIVLSCMFTLALFAACNGGTTTPTDSHPTQTSTQGGSDPAGAIAEIFFSPGDVKLEIGAPPAPALAALKEALGEPLSELEQPSCALKAKDVDYTYDGFKLTVTYPEQGEDYITTVKLSSDKYTIPGDITIGSAPEEVFAAYGTDYRESNGHYYYTKGPSVLHILIMNGMVAQISFENAEFAEILDA